MYWSILLTFLFIFLSLFHHSLAAVFTLDAHQTHGVNNFNNKTLVDFSASSRIFSAAPPLNEIGLFTPGASNSSMILESSPLDSLVANIDAYLFQTFLDRPRGTGPFNVPIAQAPTTTLLSTSVTDRTTPRSFADSADPLVVGGPYLARGADRSVTLRDWNRAVGRIVAKCDSKGATVRIKLRDGLPLGVYTVWDIGVLDSRMDSETVSGGPFGGLPNVMTTDRRGRGSFTRRVNYCPFDKCDRMKRCTLYISLSYHFDHMVYGASATLDFAGAAVGQVASNQLQFFVNGKRLIEPHRAF